ncbi:unnamed protein product, partial [Prorocentrum cordatum]
CKQPPSDGKHTRGGRLDPRCPTAPAAPPGAHLGAAGDEPRRAADVQDQRASGARGAGRADGEGEVGRAEVARRRVCPDEWDAARTPDAAADAGAPWRAAVAGPDLRRARSSAAGATVSARAVRWPRADAPAERPAAADARRRLAPFGRRRRRLLQHTPPADGGVGQDRYAATKTTGAARAGHDARRLAA